MVVLFGFINWRISYRGKIHSQVTFVMLKITLKNTKWFFYVIPTNTSS